jgi:hypothetical protein
MQIHGVGIITGCIYVSLGFGFGAALVYMVLINELVLGCQDFLRVEGIKISASNYGRLGSASRGSFKLGKGV